MKKTKAVAVSLCDFCPEGKPNAAAAKCYACSKDLCLAHRIGIVLPAVTAQDYIQQIFSRADGLPFTIPSMASLFGVQIDLSVCPDCTHRPLVDIVTDGLEKKHDIKLRTKGRGR